MNWFKKTFEIGHSGHQQLRSMEGLRGFAVCLVFLVHYVTLIEPWLGPGSLTMSVANVLRNVGHAGVDLFFVLSGYLIYGSLIAKPRRFGPYFRRRVQRIYPTFLAVFLGYLFLAQVFPAESKIPAGFSSAAIYIIQNLLLLPGLFKVEPLITVAWSLSYEMFYYLTIPLLITMVNLRMWRTELRIGFFIGIAGCIALYSLFDGSYMRLVMFIAGIILYETLVKKGEQEDDMGQGLVALIVGFVAILLLSEYDIHGSIRFLVLFVTFYLLCRTCFSGQGITSRVFSWTPMRWLGNMSYSYYLIHGLTLKAIFLLLAYIYAPNAVDSALFWFVLPPAFLITLLPSTVLFITIEKPYSLGCVIN